MCASKNERACVTVKSSAGTRISKSPFCTHHNTTVIFLTLHQFTETLCLCGQACFTRRTATCSCVATGCRWSCRRGRRRWMRRTCRRTSTSALSTSGKAGMPPTWAGSPSPSGQENCRQLVMSVWKLYGTWKLPFNLVVLVWKLYGT